VVIKKTLLGALILLALSASAQAAEVSVGEVFSRPETRVLFIDYFDLEEVGRRILGKIDTNFEEGEGGRICTQLLHGKSKKKKLAVLPDESDDWLRLFHVLTTNPNLRAFALELAQRVDRFLQDPSKENEPLITIEFATPSNVIDFVGSDTRYILERPMAPGNLGWYGRSDPDQEFLKDPKKIVSPAVSAEISAARDAINTAMRMLRYSFKHVKTLPTDETKWRNFYRDFGNLGRLLQGFMSRGIPELAEIARGCAATALVTVSPLSTYVHFVKGMTPELIKTHHSYQEAHRALARLVTPDLVD
jgi:hypothetical protein